MSLRAIALTLCAALLAACDPPADHDGAASGPKPRADSAGPDPGPASNPAPPSSAPTFSREAFAPSSADAGAIDLAVPATADPAALDEILAAAPKTPPAPLDADAGAIGSDTGIPFDGGPPARSDAGTEPPKLAKITVGKPSLVPDMSNPSIERAARAELYWPLVQRCRAPGGALLPPETVHLKFQIDREGYIVPASILAMPKDPRFSDAARCMARLVASSSFRAPPSARNQTHTVDSDVPSVD